MARKARGSVFYRDGSWRVVISLGNDPLSGKRRQLWRTAATEDEAERLRTALLAQLDRGEIGPARAETLSAFLDSWLPTRKGVLAGGTWSNYALSIRVHIAPALGKVRLDRLTPAQIAAFEAKLARDASPSAVLAAHTVLSAALGQAFRWGMIPRNPVAAVERPTMPVKERPVWDHATREAFATRAMESDEVLARGWIVLAYTGLRLGEMLALRWQDVDTERGLVTVRQTVKRAADGGWEIGPPKTRSSERVAPLPARAAEALRIERRAQNARRLALGKAWRDRDLCFDHGDGDFWPLHVVSMRWRRLVRRWGFPPIRAHDLRHTFNSLAIEDGIPLPLASRLMGHSQTQMTLRYMQMDARTVERMVAQLNAADAARHTSEQDAGKGG